jgi:transposase
VTGADTVAWADEMRVGLMGMVRRVWAPRGVKVRQRLQMVREWRYLHLAVDVRAGRLWWTWTDRMPSEVIATVVLGWRRHTDLTAVVWDGASSHRGDVVTGLGFPLVIQPSYAPELNPAERVFEELRRAVEGRVYASLEDKGAAIERELRAWDADPDRVRRLVGWHWVIDALAQLPPAVHKAA